MKERSVREFPLGGEQGLQHEWIIHGKSLSAGENTGLPSPMENLCNSVRHCVTCNYAPVLFY